MEISSECPRCPLAMDEGLIQFDGHCHYKLERDDFYGWLLFQKRPEHDWRQMLGFTEDPQIDLDYLTATYYFNFHPDSSLNKVVRISIHAPDCLYAIRNHTFLVEQGDIQISAKPLSREEEEQMIQDFFHLKIEK